MAWLPTAPYDIICLQEVHFGLGKESSSWVSAGWRFVTTVDASNRYQGVAILVRESLCRTGEMHYQELIPGRLLHVRVAQEHHSLDLVGVYQHALHLEAGRKNLHQRHKLWEKLGALLHNLSRRNMLVMLGDYNCTPEYVDGAMGHRYEKASNYPDANEFAAMIETHDLVLLNGWIRLKLQHTFTGAKHQSTIDFLITRRHHADGPARKTRTIPSINFSPWRMGGRHLAVGATLPLHPGWTSTSRYHSQVQAKYDKIQLDHEARHGGDRICALRVAMQAYLQQHDSATLEQINAQLLLQVSRLFPRRSTAPVQRAWNNPQVRGSVTAMWQARAHLRNIWSTNLTRLRYRMEAFKRHRAFMQAYRLLKQNGRQARRALLTNELAAAAEAAQRNDSGQLHRIIRRLAPKSKRVQVRIHGPNGEMLRDAAEHEAIVEYFEDLFQSQQESMNIERGTDAAPQVTEKDVYDSLCLTKYGKAVPPQAAPSSAIKCCADILAQAITPTVNACLQGAATPPRWANCHLALIPKPHKVAKRPANLRPLGLQDCNAKAYARILKHLLLQDVATALASMPVFAYIPSRGTDDAIARVSDHCRRVRLIHQQQVSNVHTYRAHKPKLGAYGGLQLAIDLTTAFDTVPRDELGRALSWAGANSTLIATILDLHSVCQYTIQHKGRSKCIHMRRGVRQGCTLAPLLYVIFSAYLISKLQARLPADWVRNHLTLYADDSHASFEISSTDDIIRSMHIIKCLFDVYREHGMCVNPLKSGVVLGVRGLKATELLNRHLQGKGDQQCLVIGLGKDELRIPVKTSMTYLGICVSYGNFEQETLSARLKVAQATRCRLSKVLSAHRYLTQQQRIHLYVLCVRSAALYGLGAVGLTIPCLRKLQIFEVKHIRAIVRSPVHLTRETTAHLYKRLKLQMPTQQLYDVLRNRASRLRVPDVHKQWISERCGWMKELLLLQTTGLEPVPVVQEIACPTCGQYFPTLQAMRQHHTRTHKIRMQFKAQGPAGRLHALRTQDHSENNMPICKHCKVKLASWHNFRVHILTSCPVLHAQRAQPELVGSAEQSAAGPAEEPSLRSALQYAAGPDAPGSTEAPVAERSEVLALLPQQNWKNILWLDGVKEHLRNHCILCAQWISSAPGALNKHMFSLHPEVSRHSAEASAQSLTLREGQQRPCGACGARPLHRTKHKCRVLYQICLLRQIHLQALTSHTLRLLSPAPRNGPCSDRSPVRGKEDVPSPESSSGVGRGRGSSTGGCCHAPGADSGQTTEGRAGDGAPGQVPAPGRQRPECPDWKEPGSYSPKPVVSEQGGRTERSSQPTPNGAGQTAPTAPAVDEEGMGGLASPGLQQGENQSRTSKGAGGPEGGCSALGSDSHETRGRAESKEDGDGLSLDNGSRVLGVGEHGRHPGAALQDGGGMEGEARKRRSQKLLTAYFVHRPPHVPRTQGPGSHELSGLPGESGEAGIPETGGRKPCLELPSMESRQRRAGADGQSSTTGPGTPVPSMLPQDVHRSPRSLTQVPQLPQAGGEPQDGGDLLFGNRVTRPAVAGMLQGNPAIMLQRQHSIDQDENPSHKDGKAAVGQGAAGAVSASSSKERGPGGNLLCQGEAELEEGPGQGQEPKQGLSARGGESPGEGCSGLPEPMKALAKMAARPQLRLVLHNPHQLCYANSVVHVYLWLGAVHMQHEGSAVTFGKLESQCLQLLRTERTCLLDHGSWRSLLTAWRSNLQQQQDAAEFLHFLLEHAKPAAYEGEWQGRYTVRNLTFFSDRGHCYQPIALEIHQDGLQASIQAWHQQHYTHALRQAPRLLYLMIKRYTRHLTGPRKITTFMDYQVGATLWFPVFSSARGLEVTWQGYTILGMVVHTGNSVRSGHYQALLSGYRRYPAAHRWVTLFADDGRPVRDATEHQLQHSKCNNYIIGLKSLEMHQT